MFFKSPKYWLIIAEANLAVYTKHRTLLFTFFSEQIKTY
jgi:hypothetical protein